MSVSPPSRGMWVVPCRLRRIEVRASPKFLPLVLTVLWSCGGSDSPAEPPTPVPTTLQLSMGTVELGALGAAQQLEATVKDQSGAVMMGAVVIWLSSSPSVSYF